jgi:pimeloyl-ACP methyl ester carboxylesterase
MYVQVSVPAGSFGIIATDDAMAGRHRLEPDDPADWSNRITARSILDITLSRPVRRARQAQCPLLMVVAQDDTMAPTAPAVRVATRAPQGELYRSRGGHYDVYKDGLDHQRVLDTETAFLHKHSSGAERSHVVAPAAHTDSS